jgi:hypothetical protein
VLSVFIGSLTAPSVAAFTVRGALYSANLDINNLTKLSVTGAITSSTISGTNLLAVSAASISGSTILAGISAPATLPIATLGTGIIGSLTIKSAAGFDSTTVAAGTIKNVSLKAITYDNNGTPFGFEAQTYGTVSIPKLHWNSHEKIATLTAASKQDFEVIAG